MSEIFTSKAKRLELTGGITLGLFPQPDVVDVLYELSSKKILPGVQLNVMKHFLPPLHILFYVGLTF